MCLQGDERPEDSKDHAEDSEVIYNDDTIYNFYFLRNLFALASLQRSPLSLLCSVLPFLLSDGSCNVVIYMCYSSLLLVAITKVQSFAFLLCTYLLFCY